MGRNILKNTGRIIHSLFFIFLCTGLYAAEIETELSPSRIAAGESASLRIRITGKTSDVKPVKFPAINGLQITFSGSSRSFQFVNGKTWSGTVLSFSIYGERKGEYKIPPFILEADGERIASREVALSVSDSSSDRGGGAGQLRGDVELSSETVYSGEPFIMQYVIHDNGGDPPEIEGFSEQPHVKGFVMKALNEKPGESGKTYAGSFCLVPIDKGTQEIGGGSVVVSVDMTQGFFSMSGRRKVIFPYKKINVIPIPSAGKPERFTGDVGEFKIDAQVPSGNFKLFEEIKIPVKISGRGNLLTLSKPQIENEDGIKTVIEEKEQNLAINAGSLTGEKNYLITIIPQKDGAVNPGRIFIECFNPYKKVYEKAESLPLSFDVEKGTVPNEKGEVQFSSDSSSGNRSNYLTAGLIAAGLIVIILVLILWERKKLKIIQAELKPDLPDESLTHEEYKGYDILKNLQLSVKDKNNDMFLLNADRGINQIDPAKLSAGELVKYNIFKDRIYYCRYGGGEFDESGKNELSEWLKKNLR